MKFTVLLLYPDYIADTFGHDTYLAHVEAATETDAVLAAQTEADASLAKSENTPGPEMDIVHFHVLAVFYGWHDDMNPYA